MKITIYFDPNTLSVLDEVHFQQITTDNTEKVYKDHKTFRNWLLQNFYAEEIFNMDESDKEQAYLEYHKYCYQSAKDTLLQRYEKREVEI